MSGMTEGALCFDAWGLSQILRETLVLSEVKWIWMTSWEGGRSCEDGCLIEHGGHEVGCSLSLLGFWRDADPSWSPCSEPFGFAQARLRRMDQDDHAGKVGNDGVENRFGEFLLPANLLGHETGNASKS
jgi:hypothetical protein